MTSVLSLCWLATNWQEFIASSSSSSSATSHLLTTIQEKNDGNKEDVNKDAVDDG